MSGRSLFHLQPQSAVLHSAARPGSTDPSNPSAAQCGLVLEQRARCGVVFAAQRIGQCMRASRPRAVSVAPGGVVLSVAGKRHAILLSRVGAFEIKSTYTKQMKVLRSRGQ